MPIDIVTDEAITATLHEAAIYYAELGYSVFPCRPGRKNPATKHGFHDATTDLDQIDAWWTANPKYNVGIATAGLLVVDIDGAANPWLTPDRASDLATASQRTPRGGWHYVFRAPAGAGLRNTESQLAPKIDTRANGGYIVAAPSIVGDGQYEWVEPLDCPATLLPEPPSWLMGELDQAAKRKTDRQADHTADGGTYAEGSRNSRLTSYAGYLRRGGATEEEILAALYVRNRRCKPPLEEDELHRIAASVSRYEPSVDPTDNTDEPAPPIRIYTLGELCDEHPKVRPPVIDGLLRQGEVGNIIAAPKVGKSWLAYSLALSVVTGEPWLGFSTTPGRVLLLDNELHPSTIASRIPLVAKSAGVDEGIVRDNLHVVPMRGNLLDLHGIGRIIQRVERGQYALIILDAFYRALPPDKSENDNAAMAALFNLIDSYCGETDAAWFNIHHSSKGVQTQKSVTDVGAGAGSQSRAADCHLVLREHEEDDTVVLDAVVRSFGRLTPRVLRWEFPLWRPDEDADPDALKGRKTDRERRQDSDDLKGQGAVLDALEGWMTVSDLAGRTGFGDRRVKRLLGQLVASGHCEISTEERRGVDRDVWRKTLKARD